jgi:glycosyltransferase involved in cell wall biosynthesis
MKILIALTYYRPHISGLTIYAERLARGLVRRGHEVTVMTSHNDRTTPLREVVDGVRIVRVPVAFRVSKGVIMPTVGFVAWRLVWETEVLCLHLPQFDAAGISARGRLLGKPTTTTYHCDLKLPFGPLSGLASRVVNVANHFSGVFSDRVVTNTQDYADHSPYLLRFAQKVKVIAPPVEVYPVTPGQVRAFAQKHGLDGRGPVIGMAARLAAEKGVEILLEALPRVLEVYPEARVLYVGQRHGVVGEEAYARRLAPLFERYRDRWVFLDILSWQELAAFYSNLDVIAVPSLNPTESFGMVQAEAMLCGAPAVASALPGVRQPVLQSGMGELVPVDDSGALAEAIVKVIRNRPLYVRSRDEIAELWSTERTAAEYEALFEQLLRERQGR